MSLPLVIAGSLSVLIGIAHSVLGEKLLLGPLFERGDLPKLLGSSAFARQTLRFAWHLTTILLAGIGVAIFALSWTSAEPLARQVLRIFAVMFGGCSLLSLFGARAKHFSWWVFLIIAALLWIGAR